MKSEKKEQNPAAELNQEHWGRRLACKKKLDPPPLHLPISLTGIYYRLISSEDMLGCKAHDTLRNVCCIANIMGHSLLERSCRLQAMWLIANRVWEITGAVNADEVTATVKSHWFTDRALDPEYGDQSEVQPAVEVTGLPCPLPIKLDLLSKIMGSKKWS